MSKKAKTEVVMDDGEWETYAEFAQDFKKPEMLDEPNLAVLRAACRVFVDGMFADVPTVSTAVTSEAVFKAAIRAFYGADVFETLNEMVETHMDFVAQHEDDEMFGDGPLPIGSDDDGDGTPYYVNDLDDVDDFQRTDDPALTEKP